ETWTRAAVADERFAVAADDAEPEAPRRFEVGIDEVHPVHLAQRIRIQHFGAAASQQAELPRREAPEIADCRRITGGRRDAPGLKERSRPARAGARHPAVARREVLPSLHFRHLGGGAGEAQRLENVALDIIGVRDATLSGDDL